MSQASTDWKTWNSIHKADRNTRPLSTSLMEATEHAIGSIFAATLLFAVVAFPLYKREWLGFVPVVVAGILFLATRRFQTTRQIIQFVGRLSEKEFALLLIAIAIGFRAAAILCFAAPPVSDHATYHESAVRMLNGHGYPPSAYYPPGMAHWLFAVYSIFGQSVSAALGVNIAIGALMCWLTYVAGRAVISQPAARIAALTCAVFPSLVLYTTTLGYDPLLGCALLLAVWLFTRRPAQLQRWWYVSLIGITLGAASFFKPIALLMPILFAIAYYRRSATKARTIRNSLILTAAMIVTLAPWSLRNAALFGKYVPVTTSGGVGLWVANHEGATGLSCPLPWFPPDTSEIERDRILWKQAWEYMAANPVETLMLLPKKAAYLWGTSSTVMATVSADRWNPYLEAAAKAIINVAWGTTILWFVYGVWAKRKLFTDSRYLWPAGMMLIYLFGVHQFYEAQSRYHLPFIPFLLMGAAATLCHHHRCDGSEVTP